MSKPTLRSSRISSSLITSRIISSLITAGLLFGTHFGAGWSWQTATVVAFLSQAVDYLGILSRQLEGKL